MFELPDGQMIVKPMETVERGEDEAGLASVHESSPLIVQRWTTGAMQTLSTVHSEADNLPHTVDKAIHAICLLPMTLIAYGVTTSTNGR